MKGGISIMGEDMILYEALRIKIGADKLEFPNSPDGRRFIIPLSMEFLHSGATVEDINKAIKLTGIEGQIRQLDDGWHYLVFKNKHNIDRLVASTNIVGVLKQDGNYALLVKYHRNNEVKEFVVVWNMQVKGYKCVWMQGYYCLTLKAAVDTYLSKVLLGV